MSDANKNVYLDDRIVTIYANKTKLYEPEVTLFAAIKDEVAGQPIFDIGIGTGRTTPFLRELSQDYLGCDYSEKMTRYCERLYPGVRFDTVDARDMKGYRDGQFAFVIFSFNGIDSVPPDDRLAILKECHRVLRPGGLFAFSSHNIEKPVHGAFHLSNIEFTLHPIRLARELQKYFTGWFHHLRNRKREIFTDEYTVRNDNAHNYTLMHYYISKANQVRQLQRFGFEDVRIIDRKGAWTDAATPDATSSWIYYLARKKRA